VEMDAFGKSLLHIFPKIPCVVNVNGALCDKTPINPQNHNDIAAFPCFILLALACRFWNLSIEKIKFVLQEQNFFHRTTP